MNRLASAFLPAALLAALACLPAPRPARGCAAVWEGGSHVAIAGESALVVWDEKTKTQHFIRRASFRTKVPYFGFLVPTPTRPTLAEAPDEVFRKLEDWTKPETRTERRYVWPFSMSASLDGEGGTALVELLDRQRVGGLDAAVLKATDSKALREWLQMHGYDARPQLTGWLEPYIRKGWIITAFQIAKKDKQEDSLSTQAVRMSFRAERPFFPYREPADPHPGAGNPWRLLRVFLRSEERRVGKR